MRTVCNGLGGLAAGLLAAGLIASTALAASGCDETVTIPNRPPTVTFDALEADGEILEIYYNLFDLDGDDVDIELTVCRGTDCQPATEATGSDGQTTLPTDPDGPVLHLFRWAAGCDLTGAAFDEELVVRIAPSDEDEGLPAQSGVFVLSELGVTEGCTPVE